ncbi:MAG TPA: sugar phosphate nucleotidyltransferase [Planctomycetota bacterium]|nr:sugar phosphate nucleotidyltransferase [Planctomycetota bacterium]
MTRLFAILMAGGSGTRFWPASRKDRPKQLLPIGTARPLLAETSERLGSLIPPEQQLVITSARYAAAVRELLPGVPADQVVGEPEGRDTAACIGLAGRLLARLDADAVGVAMPSDHVLSPVDVFLDHLRAAQAALQARPESLLVFGVQPDRPATGYGWLRRGAAVGTFGGRTVHRLEGFVEKPDLPRARELLASGDHLWNAGLFAFRPAVMEAAIARHLPALAPGLTALAAAWRTPRFEAALAEHYPKLTKISIDYGVMEKVSEALVLPLVVRWDDVGAWDALARLLPADAAGNVAQGAHLLLDGRNLLVSSTGGLVAARGVSDLIIVHTPDATLVCRRDDAEGVKAIVQELERRGLGRFA